MNNGLISKSTLNCHKRIDQFKSCSRQADYRGMQSCGSRFPSDAFIAAQPVNVYSLFNMLIIVAIDFFQNVNLALCPL